MFSVSSLSNWNKRVVSREGRLVSTDETRRDNVGEEYWWPKTNQRRHCCWCWCFHPNEWIMETEEETDHRSSVDFRAVERENSLRSVSNISRWHKYPWLGMRRTAWLCSCWLIEERFFTPSTRRNVVEEINLGENLSSVTDVNVGKEIRSWHSNSLMAQVFLIELKFTWITRRDVLETVNGTSKRRQGFFFIVSSLIALTNVIEHSA